VSFRCKCLALTAFVAVLTPTAAYADDVIKPRPTVISQEYAQYLAETEHFTAALKQSQEDRWWAWAAIQEWNKAVGENWKAAYAALHPARTEHRDAPRASGGGTYTGTATGSVNGHPCGGDLPSCYILNRESHGTNAENPSSSASGYWQFIDGTWNGFGGYSHASDAPPEVQDEKARQTWAGGAGAGHWACC
jgi:hypothetical protein